MAVKGFAVCCAPQWQTQEKEYKCYRQSLSRKLGEGLAISTTERRAASSYHWWSEVSFATSRSPFLCLFGRWLRRSSRNPFHYQSSWAVSPPFSCLGESSSRFKYPKIDWRFVSGAKTFINLQDRSKSDDSILLRDYQPDDIELCLRSGQRSGEKSIAPKDLLRTTSILRITQIEFRSESIPKL